MNITKDSAVTLQYKVTDDKGKPLDNGSVRPLSVKVGDKVLFGKYAGTEQKVDGVEYVFIKEDDIFAVLG